MVVARTSHFRFGRGGSGLVGAGLVLQNNGADDLAVASNGAFTFGGQLTDGSAYVVTVKSQPNTPGQACTVTQGTGTMTPAGVNNVAVACVTPTARFAYVANQGGNSVSAYTVAASGALTPVAGGAVAAGTTRARWLWIRAASLPMSPT